MNNTVPQARAAIAAALDESMKLQRRPALSMFATMADYQAARAEHEAAPVAPICTCSSGDGSLCWPCPIHRPQPSERNEVAP